MNPKVILQEWDLSDYIPSYAGIYAALIGAFYKGPSFKRVLCTSPSDATSKFGIPTHNSTQAYFSALTYLEKSNKLWMTRVHDDARFASVVIKASTNGKKKPSFDGFNNSGIDTINYEDETTWPENIELFVVIARDISNDKVYVCLDNIDYENKTFDLYVYEDISTTTKAKPVKREIFSNLTRDPSSPYYFETYINRRSKLITIIDNVRVEAQNEGDKATGIPKDFMPKSEVKIVNGSDVVVQNTSSNPGKYAIRLAGGGAVTVKDNEGNDVSNPDGTPKQRYFYHGAMFYAEGSQINCGPLIGGTSVEYINNCKPGAPEEDVYDATDQSTVIGHIDGGLVSGSLYDSTLKLGEPVIDDNLVFSDMDEDVFLVYAASEGTWGNDLSVRIENVDTDEREFDLVVYTTVNNLSNIEVERHRVSLTPKKNGYGRNMFIETKVNLQSQYIRVHLSPYFDMDAGYLPFESVSAAGAFVYHKLSDGTDGKSGSSGNIRTGKLLLGLDLYRDRETVNVTLFLDGGHADPAWKKALVSICEDRMDCMAILTVPVEDEMAGAERIVEWRQKELMINSSYGALYTPSVYIHDKYNDERSIVPIDGMIGGIYSRTAVSYEMWYRANCSIFKRYSIEELSKAA